MTGDPKSANGHKSRTSVERLIAEAGTELTQARAGRSCGRISARNSPSSQQETGRIERLRRRPVYPPALVFRERPRTQSATDTRHHRGEYLQPRDVVAPARPTPCMRFPQALPRNRLGLRAVARRRRESAHGPRDREPPVGSAVRSRPRETVDDFGTQAASPRIRSCLDWLAVEFVNQGWSLKWLHRTLVTSATYRQSSRVTAAALAADPDNLLLARASAPPAAGRGDSRSVLRASGLLSLEMGGPGVHPPQPAGVTEVAWGKPSGRQAREPIDTDAASTRSASARPRSPCTTHLTPRVVSRAPPGETSPTRRCKP